MNEVVLYWLPNRYTQHMCLGNQGREREFIFKTISRIMQSESLDGDNIIFALFKNVSVYIWITDDRTLKA